MLFIIVTLWIVILFFTVMGVGYMLTDPFSDVKIVMPNFVIVLVALVLLKLLGG